MTLAVAIERYTTVCHPFFKVSYKTEIIGDKTMDDKLRFRKSTQSLKFNLGTSIIYSSMSLPSLDLITIKTSKITISSKGEKN